MSVPELRVFVGAPEAFAPRAAWVLQTLLAPLGRRAAVTHDPAQAGEAALAYAPEPVAGVPTIPCDAGAMELFAEGRPLPAGAFAAVTGGDGAAVAAWPADPGAGFAVPFDLVASAFVLLACWDEHTTAERDKYGRLPYSASVFATNPELPHRGPGRGRLRRAPAWRPGAAPRRARPRAAAAGGERLGSARPLRDRAHPRPGQPVAVDAARLRRRRLPHRPRGPPPAGPRRPARAGRRRRLAVPSPAAPHRPVLDVPADPRRRGRPRRLVHLLRDRPPHAQAGRQPARDLRAAHPAGAPARDGRRPRGRPARQRRRPAGAGRPRRRTGTASPGVPAAPSPASATTTCARSTTRRCRCSSRPASPTTPRWRSPSTRASAAAARSRSARTRWRRSGRSTSSSCRSP